MSFGTLPKWAESYLPEAEGMLKSELNVTYLKLKEYKSVRWSGTKEAESHSDVPTWPKRRRRWEHERAQGHPGDDVPAEDLPGPLGTTYSPSIQVYLFEGSWGTAKTDQREDSPRGAADRSTCAFVDLKQVKRSKFISKIYICVCILFRILAH